MHPWALTLVTLLLAATGSASVSAQGQASAVRVGSDAIYESRLVAEIYAQALEDAGFTVERTPAFSTRLARLAAFEAGELDLMPEYVGSGLAHYVDSSDDPGLAGLEVTSDGQTNRLSLQATFDVLGIPAAVLAISPGEDTNAAVMRRETADSYGLRLMSDLSRVQDELTWGLPRECDVSPLCKGALERYAIVFPPAQRAVYEACSPTFADALARGVIDFAWLCSTQPEIEQYDFAVLIDDLDTQPADNVAPVLHGDWLAEIDGGRESLAAILDPLSDRLTDEALRAMGAAVLAEGREIADVAREFLAG